MIYIVTCNFTTVDRNVRWYVTCKNWMFCTECHFAFKCIILFRSVSVILQKRKANSNMRAVRKAACNVTKVFCIIRGDVSSLYVCKYVIFGVQFLPWMVHSFAYYASGWVYGNRCGAKNAKCILICAQYADMAELLCAPVCYKLLIGIVSWKTRSVCLDCVDPIITCSALFHIC